MDTLRVGEVVRTGLRVWTQNLVPFVLIAIAIYIPAAILWLLLPGPTWYLVMIPVAMVLNALVGSTLTYAVVMELRGTRPAFRDCLSIGGARAVTVIGVVMLSILAIFGASMLLVVPGVIVMCNLYVAVPVSVVESSGVMASLRRSRELVIGHRGAIFGIMILTLLVTWGISELGRSLFGDDTRAIVVIGVNVLTGSLTAVMAAVAYTQLRHIKDGTQVPALTPAVATIRPPG